MMRQEWGALVAFLAFCLALVLAFSWGEHVKDLEWQAKAGKAQEQARGVEHKAAAAVAQVDTRLLNQRKTTDAKTETIVHGLHTGTVRLRRHFTASVPAAHAGTGQRDAAPQSGLSIADAEFLVRFAGEADQVAQQLAACQDVLRVDRGDLGVAMSAPLPIDLAQAVTGEGLAGDAAQAVEATAPAAHDAGVAE